MWSQFKIMVNILAICSWITASLRNSDWQGIIGYIWLEAVFQKSIPVLALRKTVKATMCENIRSTHGWVCLVFCLFTLCVCVCFLWPRITTFMTRGKEGLPAIDQDHIRSRWIRETQPLFLAHTSFLSYITSQELKHY